MYGLHTTGRVAMTGDSVWVAVVYAGGKGRIQPVSGKAAGFRWLSGRITEAAWQEWAAGRPGVPAMKPSNDEEVLVTRYGEPYQTPEKVFLDEFFFGDNNEGARVMHMLVLDEIGIDLFEQLELRMQEGAAHT
ncbi:hypothetical protein ACFXPA_20455 [Amycolatopsis sp. NPDC059090]|uniref:hypothetical protein n=1 Tax=unclassified Amycolatopsis TaxID=2618356 RepID=UPI00366AA6BB